MSSIPRACGKAKSCLSVPHQRLSGGTMDLRTSNHITFGDFLMVAQTSHSGSGLFAQTAIGKFTTARTATV
jgi:hypothetical protein